MTHDLMKDSLALLGFRVSACQIKPGPHTVGCIEVIWQDHLAMQLAGLNWHLSWQISL